MGRPITPFVLSSVDRLTIEALTRKGRHAGRTVRRGRMLLRPVDGVSGYTVAAELGCCVQTVYQVRRRCVDRGLATALGEAPRSGGPRRFDGAQRAAFTALGLHARSHQPQPLDPAPVGRQSRGAVPGGNHFARDRGAGAQKNEMQPQRQQHGCLEAVKAAFLARMEDVLAVYGRAYDPCFPLVCFDERPCVLHGQPVEPFVPMPAQPAQGEQPAKAGRPRRESST